MPPVTVARPCTAGTEVISARIVGLMSLTMTEPEKPLASAPPPATAAPEAMRLVSSASTVRLRVLKTLEFDSTAETAAPPDGSPISASVNATPPPLLLPPPKPA